ncbi:uncharacterized protein MELLADRAFT_94594 [Melampsora larici-populina 98AG31]|uniref:Uncharacterized protein n=1 Tax=Melampsora larici-populina (strain 98AG31 / pathotype 3-4-7) TaxID=747676 RepID=F4RBZ6_MELLP|nr:uncharacterized protein MELLADRAFT_94594 [Melampsora larici-populina 98AG31]EGG10251.1 hypothetical protein MELLADRAFT_94594 [Melampsora larici-populina 98AG31]
MPELSKVMGLDPKLNHAAAFTCGRIKQHPRLPCYAGDKLGVDRAFECNFVQPPKGGGEQFCQVIERQHAFTGLRDLKAKLDEDIADLSNKMDEELNVLSDRIDTKVMTVYNKVNQVNETVNHLTSHQPGTGAQGNVAPATTLPTPPWMYSPELKAVVDAAANKSVALRGITAYTNLKTPNGDLIMNSLFNTVKVCPLGTIH